MYTKLLKSITSLSLIGGALLYTNGSDVRAAEASIFSDVPTSHWSYPAIKDLSSKNIISGYGNGKFGFGDVATREQVAALIYRALLPNKQGGTFSNDSARYVLQDGSTLNNPYRDIRAGSTLFPEEVLTLTKLGILTGMETEVLDRKILLAGQKWRKLLKMLFKFRLSKSIHLMMFRMVLGRRGD